VDPNYSISQPVELGGAPAEKLRLHTVYRLYASQFRRWFAITAPTSVIASVILLIAHQRIREIFRSIPRGEIAYHSGANAEAGVLRYASFFIAWFLGCFALAAIAAVVNGLESEDDTEVWRSDSFQRARQHLGRLLLAAFITSSMFLLGMAVLLFVEVTLFRRFGWAQFSKYNYGASLVGILIIASIVSWFGMAIPLIVSDDIGGWAALRKSFRLSNGYETFLSLLVLESTLGSFVAWYATRFGLDLIVPAYLRYTTWYGWLIYFVGIFAAAAVEPPMFIGFSLLASTKRDVNWPPPGGRPVR
jgi:hypothetical protein